MSHLFFLIKKNMVRASTATRVMMQAVFLLASLAAGTCVCICWYAHCFIPVLSISRTIIYVSTMWERGKERGNRRRWKEYGGRGGVIQNAMQAM